MWTRTASLWDEQILLDVYDDSCSWLVYIGGGQIKLGTAVVAAAASVDSIDDVRGDWIRCISVNWVGDGGLLNRWNWHRKKEGEPLHCGITSNVYIISGKWDDFLIGSIIPATTTTLYFPQESARGNMLRRTLMDSSAHSIRLIAYKSIFSQPIIFIYYFQSND